jgi:bacteriorhodopsin
MLLLQTVYLSLFIQIITGITDLYVLVAVKSENLFYNALLLLEIIVQAIEGTFYVWMASLFSSIKNVTPKRYFDWAFSTPIMLFTLCIYLDYLNKEKKDLQHLKHSTKLKIILINLVKDSKDLGLIFFPKSNNMI